MKRSARRLLRDFILFVPVVGASVVLAAPAAHAAPAPPAPHEADFAGQASDIVAQLDRDFGLAEERPAPGHAAEGQASGGRAAEGQVVEVLKADGGQAQGAPGRR
ncbi:hypothetical protein [Actinomadura sp. WMMB 499]|uniref:hypothetical protein n=1 Tax=Actinomadura sp. WMMB 499 TaxID=1219491 RepID=UPI0012473F3D|nr:hypothetical protein [Actinomadura sp. WMMB 499]QFG23354.1 hypothetical protein F7P10_21780 [Actinomadura sp. WMMB 499]